MSVLAQQDGKPRHFSRDKAGRYCQRHKLVHTAL
jgi:hypothetical protein